MNLSSKIVKRIMICILSFHESDNSPISYRPENTAIKLLTFPGIIYIFYKVSVKLVLVGLENSTY